MWCKFCTSSTSSLELAAVIPDLREIARTVAAGLGMSVLPRYLIEDMLVDRRLVPLFSPQIPPLNTLHVATRQGVVHKDREIRDLRDYLLGDARRHAAMS